LRSGAFASKSVITIRVQVTWSVQSLSIASWIATTLSVFGIVIALDARALAAPPSSAATAPATIRNAVIRRAFAREPGLALIKRTS
jgi:hypothetical protein